MTDDRNEQDPQDKQAEGKAPRKRPTLREAAENHARFKRKLDSYIQRKPNGQFAPGTPSPNPQGARKKDQRMFGMSQTTKDLLELLEQPVTIMKGKGKKKQVPAIVAIYDKMIHMAVGGDWQAMKKCVELRERYSDSREQTLGNLLAQAGSIRRSYQGAEDEMPDDLRNLVEFIELNVAYGQYRAG